MKISNPKITPFLWFDNNAREAVKFYTSIFKNSKIISLDDMVSTFEIERQTFMALNGGPAFKFTEAISFYISCETQEEVDYYWKELQRDGGSPVQCGWLKDRFGLSWQIVPDILREMMNSPDKQKREKVLQAILKMIKIDFDALKKAFEE